MMYSYEHSKFLKKIKKNKLKIIISQIFIIVGIILFWQLGAMFNLIDTFIYSSPYDVVLTIISLIKNNNLFYHIYVTLYEVLISFILGSFLGLFIASILWSNKVLAKILEPYLTFFNSLPKVALGPIIIIWTGASDRSIIVLSLLISVFITIINLYQAFTNTPSHYIKLMNVFKASKLEIYTNVIIPYNYRVIMNCLKVNISMSLIGVIMGEFLVSKAGIGYLIMYGSQVFNLDLVISGVLILGCLSIVLYSIIVYIEKKVIKN